MCNKNQYGIHICILIKQFYMCSMNYESKHLLQNNMFLFEDNVFLHPEYVGDKSIYTFRFSKTALKIITIYSG
jgi:hypothetical protein